MRRPVPLLLLLVSLAACSTPPIVLTQRPSVGQVRVYRLTTAATSTTEAGGRREVERTTFVARSRLEVTATDADGATVTLTFTPERVTRDGRAAEPPPEQRAELVIDRSGAVARIASVGGVPAGNAQDGIEDLAPLLGIPLPERRVRLGERWQARIPPPETATGFPPAEPGEQTGRLAGLRVVRGFDCAMVELGTRRPLFRARPQGEGFIALQGTELSRARVAFAFHEGFPVEVRADAEARLDVLGLGPDGGTLTIETSTTLFLVEPRADD